MPRRLSRSKWIWTTASAGADEYAEFKERFQNEGGSYTFLVSVDGDYTLFVNGVYAASNQYGDFEHYKIFDEIDIAPYLRMGENEIILLVWHFGENSQRYIKAAAGAIFALTRDDKSVLVSDEHTLCRKSRAYRNGYQKKITSQLGFSFLYDSTADEGEDFLPAVVVEKHCALYPRPTEKLTLFPPLCGKVIGQGENYRLVDLGRETVGLVSFAFFSDASQKITVSWGEHLVADRVPRRIGDRDFSLEYIAKAGKNEYTNYMLRLGCRYLEVSWETPIKLDFLGVIPQIYHVNERAVAQMQPLDQRICDVCIRTLRLCMMEHYVDTPWREQCLYAFDSRNQMLCGYRAFENGNAAYARANLLLMSKDRREDGLLSICSPCGQDLVIPSFSLYYFIAVKEYIEHTGDVSLGVEVYPKLVSLIKVFLENRERGLVKRFGGENQWNFYDWSQYLSGTLWKSEPMIPDLIINSLFILALESLRVVSQAVGKPFLHASELNETRAAARDAFYNVNEGAFFVTENGGEMTVLGNALAILAGLATDPETLCEKMTDGSWVDCSFSMRCFQYDAMLRTDATRWRPYILAEIRRDYGAMLEAGATSVWETAEGETAFGNAGSLCHGWSAIPILYL